MLFGPGLCHMTVGSLYMVTLKVLFVLLNHNLQTLDSYHGSQLENRIVYAWQVASDQ